jgi:hypothetical protein
MKSCGHIRPVRLGNAFGEMSSHVGVGTTCGYCLSLRELCGVLPGDTYINLGATYIERPAIQGSAFRKSKDCVL